MRGLFRMLFFCFACLAIIGLLALMRGPSLRAAELFEGEFKIDFPYPLLGRESFPTVKEIARIAQENRIARRECARREWCCLHVPLPKTFALACRSGGTVSLFPS